MMAETETALAASKAENFADLARVRARLPDVSRAGEYPLRVAPTPRTAYGQ